MAWSKSQTALGSIIVIGVISSVVILQNRSRGGLNAENDALRRRVETLQTENERLSHPAPQPNAQLDAGESAELLRLRGEVGVLRRQADELTASLAKAQNTQSGRSEARPESPSRVAEEYPKTPEAATERIFDTLLQGDIQKFFTNFGEPGVPKEVYDKLFNTDSVKGYLANIETISLGSPTNSFGSNMWFVPYRIRFKDGSEKELRLHVAQDPRSQKWFFKGGI